MARVLGILVSTAVALLLTAGCGQDSEVRPASGDDKVAQVDNGSTTTPAPAEDPTRDGPSDEEIEEFVAALGSRNPDQIQRVLSMTAPDSIAHAYALYNLHVGEAQLDAGVTGEQPSVEERDTGWALCDAGESGAECTLFSDFEAEAGKLTDLKVDGVKIGPRIAVGNGGKVEAGELGRVEFLVSYKTAEGDILTVIMKVQSKDEPVVVAAYDAAYRTAEGRQSKTTDHLGGSDLAANSSQTIAVQFPAAQPGGVVSLPFFSEDFMIERVATIKTR